MESGTYTLETTKIFGFKELIDKIFRTKDLASGITVPRRYARRVTYIGSIGTVKDLGHGGM
jgi:hypothetical protein